MLKEERRKSHKHPDLKWESIFQAIGHPAVILDADHNIIAVNRAVAEISGKSDEEIIGSKCYEIFHGRDSKTHPDSCPLQRLLRKNIAEPVEMEMSAFGGTFLVSCTPIFDNNGKIDKIIHIATDITAHKRLEKALRGSEARLVQAHSIGRLGTWEYDIEKDKIWGSRESALIYGVEIAGTESVVRPLKRVEEMVHPEDRSRMENVFRGLISGLNKYDEEFRIFRAGDGELRWIHSRADLVVSDDGAPAVIGILEDITERKRTEEALKHAEEKYRQLFENAIEGIFQTTPEGRLITANRALAEMFQYSSPEEMIHSVTDIKNDLYVNASERDELLNAINKNGAVFGHECELRRRDGSSIWLSISMRPVRDKDGNILYYQGFNLDITEKKATAQLVSDALLYNQAILNAAPFGIITYKASGQCVSANEEVARIVGCTVDRLLAQNFRLLKSWKESGMLEAAEQTIETGQARTSEFHLFTTFGREAWFSCSFTPLYYSGELRLLLITSDITERKAAEESLRRSEEKYRLLADNSSDVIWTLGLDGYFTYVSPSWKTLSGFETKEIVGSHFGKFIVESDVPWIMDTIATELLKDPESRLKGKIVEARQYRKDGTIIDLEVVASWLYNPDGDIIGLQGSTRDITERKRMEDNRARLEAQLAQAQKMEAIGTLAGGIAHDFNNILMSILGYTDIALASGKIDELQRHYLKQVYIAGERARDLVKQILTFSRHEEQERKPVYLEPLVRESLNLLRSSLPSTITISADIPEDSSIILANATQVQQIMMNLCANSSHAMKEGGGILEISLEQEEAGNPEMPHPPGLAPGKYARLKISDTGKGIDPAIMDRIFDPFFTTKPPEEGTGLGLSVVYGIVRNHGGAIDISSRPGRGTMVTVYLPIHKEGRPAVEEISEPIPRGSGRVLFVDDEPGLAELGKIMLESLGYTVTSLTGSMEALDHFRANPDGCDLVITDMTMPKMTGAELARRMLEIRADIPIILCTGYSDIISEEKAKKIGIRHFILKPISMKILADLISGVLDNGN